MSRFLKTLQNSDSGGFTLIEVLIVLAIFSIGILGAMSMQTSAINLNTNSQKSSLAMAYATDTMERLMALPSFNGLDDDGDGTVDDSTEAGFNDLAQAKNPHSRADAYDSDNNGLEDIPVDAYYNSIFNLTWNVTDVPPVSPNTTLIKRIAITVKWNKGTRQAKLTAIRINQ